VRRAGGKVDPGYISVGESDGLPMTRAIGDLPLKVAQGCDWRETSVDKQVVTALPEVGVRPRGNEDLALVLASDGLFGNVMTSAQVATEVREQLKEHAYSGDAEGKTARHLIDCALLKHKGGDNVSVVVVALEPPPLISGPIALEHISSQESLATAPYSPSRLQLNDKLQMKFADAYPLARRVESDAEDSEQVLAESSAEL